MSRALEQGSHDRMRYSPTPGAATAMGDVLARHQDREFARQCGPDPDVAARMYTRVSAHPGETRPATWDSMVSGVRWRPQIEFSGPVAQTCGARHVAFPGAHEAILAWRERLSAGSAIDIAVAGHLAPWEQSHAFRTAVRTVLHRVKSMLSDTARMDHTS